MAPATDWLPWLRQSRAAALGALAAAALLCLLTGSSLFWTVALPEQAGLGSAPAQSTTSSPITLSAQLPLSGFHLFGTSGAPLDVQSASAAPETQLNLVLIGTIAGKDPRLGLALIADDKDTQAYFEPGQRVAGATLEAVYTDRVTLSVSGRVETLRLRRPEGVDGLLKPASSAVALVPSISEEIAASDKIAAANGIGFIAPMGQGIDVSSIRNSLIDNPKDLLSKVSVVPIAGANGLEGVKISAPGYEQVLTQAGLLPSDVVVAVNGMRIDSVERGLQIAEVIRSADQLTVTVRREGREQTLAPLKLK